MDEKHWVQFRDPKIGTTAIKIAEQCGWLLKRDGDEVRICANERELKSAPRLFSLQRLIDSAGANSSALLDVTRWGHDDLYGKIISKDEIAAEVARLTATETREGGWAAHSLVSMSTGPSDMPDFLLNTYRDLADRNLFPDLSVWAVREEPIAHFRHQYVRTLVLAEHYPDEVDLVKRGLLANQMASGLSGSGLSPVGGRLTPLLVSAAPWIMGLVSERIGGAIVFMLGKHEYGKHSTLPHADLIDQLQSGAFGAENRGPRSQPAFSGDDAVEALRWWVQGLNALAAVELDPATHATNGTFDPVQHLATSLTIDRLIATILQISSADRRNPVARKLLFFDALELVDGLFQKFHVSTGAAAARKQLARLEADMPAAVQRVLLPRCRAAIEALEAMQHGFWVPSSITSDGVLVPTDAGLSETMTKDRAVGAVLRMIRNGHHGFVSAGFKARPRDRALLTLHDGKIPDALPDLAFFQLVRLLAYPWLLDPARLRTV